MRDTIKQLQSDKQNLENDKLVLNKQISSLQTEIKKLKNDLPNLELVKSVQKISATIASLSADSDEVSVRLAMRDLNDEAKEITEDTGDAETLKNKTILFVNFLNAEISANMEYGVLLLQRLWCVSQSLDKEAATRARSAARAG